MNSKKIIEPIVKKNTGMRNGRGFSRNELKKADISYHFAKVYKIPVDKRRSSLNEENVETLKKFKTENIK